jgi:hypothetical protein
MAAEALRRTKAPKAALRPRRAWTHRSLEAYREMRDKRRMRR